MTLTSPLRYPGSKHQLSRYVQDVLELNRLHPTLYVEPFVGGASVALHMLQLPSVEQVILMDADPWVASFWQTLFFDTTWLIEQVQAVEITMERWWQFKNARPETVREQALTLLFLSRTNYSGILEGRVGPIGGKEQRSAYDIACRFPRATLIRRIEQIATYRDKIRGIWACSWDDGVARLLELQQAGEVSCNAFWYCDPPYYGPRKLYRYEFSDTDHRQLRDFLMALQQPWLLSYDVAPVIRELYAGAQVREIEWRYSSVRSRGRELLISNSLILQ